MIRIEEYQCQNNSACEDTGPKLQEVVVLQGEAKTAYDENGRAYCMEATGKEAQHIAELLAAEFDGRLVVLPCKVGDRVFSDKGNPLSVCISRTDGDRINQIKIARNGYHFKCWWGWFHKSDIGKTIFLTREEAEAALAARKREMDNT